MEYLGGKPLCMNQYYQILSSCRVPGPKHDSVLNFSKTKKPPMHITVVHNNQVRAPSAARRRGRARSRLPPHRCPCAPRNGPALGISSGCLGTAMQGCPPLSLSLDLTLSPHRGLGQCWL